MPNLNETELNRYSRRSFLALGAAAGAAVLTSCVENPFLPATPTPTSTPRPTRTPAPSPTSEPRIEVVVISVPIPVDRTGITIPFPVPSSSQPEATPTPQPERFKMPVGTYDFFPAGTVIGGDICVEISQGGYKDCLYDSKTKPYNPQVSYTDSGLIVFNNYGKIRVDAAFGASGVIMTNQPQTAIDRYIYDRGQQMYQDGCENGGCRAVYLIEIKRDANGNPVKTTPILIPRG